MILPGTERTGAVKLAEALRRRVEDLGIVHPTSRAAAVVTIGCGAATAWPTLGVELEKLIRLADESLYVAKHTGRNRTVAEHGAPHSSAQSLAAP